MARSWVDRSSFGNAGNGMPDKSSDLRRGADAPKNESGRSSPFSSFDQSRRDVSAGKGFFIVANLFNSEFGIPSMCILHTRSCCLSATIMFAIPRGRLPTAKTYMKIGRAGQMSSIFVTCRFWVQRSCKFRRFGDANTISRHRRHTWISVCHASSSST